MENLSHEEKLQLTMHHKARTVCAETVASLGVTLTDEALNLVGEVAWKVTQNFARDLELFARHAKRSSINSEDVKLLVRKNPALTKVVIQMASAHAAAKTTPATKRKSSNNREPVYEKPLPGPSWLADDSDDFIVDQ